MNEIMPFAASWMDLESFIPREVSQTEKEKYHTISFICEIYKEMIQTNLRNRKSLIDLENKLMIAGRKGELGSLGKVGYLLLYSKQITNKDLLYSTANSTQYYVAT